MTSGADKKIRSASAELSMAVDAIEAGVYQRAIASLRKGIAVIGDSYASDDVIDETGMKILLADTSLREGREREAAELLRRALETRLELLIELTQRRPR